jgi:outer membrane protein assembly factor BamB
MVPAAGESQPVRQRRSRRQPRSIAAPGAWQIQFTFFIPMNRIPVKGADRSHHGRPIPKHREDVSHARSEAMGVGTTNHALSAGHVVRPLTTSRHVDPADFSASGNNRQDAPPHDRHGHNFIPETSMRSNDLRFVCLVLAGFVSVCLFGTSLDAQEKSADWRQFRGPGGQGVSPAKKIPLTWSETENLLWKTDLPGAGSSSPIVVGSRVYLTCYSGYNVPGQNVGDMEQLKLHLVCLDRNQGKILWNSEVAPVLPEQENIRDGHGYASSTPASDGERIYVFFGKSGAMAFDLEGNPLWRTDLGSERSGFGSGASPIVYRDLLIVNASVESESLVALDKKTGKEKWRVEGVREAFNTPVLVPVESGKTELVAGMPGKVQGIDPDTGKELWTCANEITWYIVPSVVAHQGVVWSLGGRSGVTAVALRAGGRGDVTETHRLWTSRKGCNVLSPIYHEGHLYWINDNEIALCAEATSGKIVFEERVDRADQVWASPVLADGKLYYVSRRGDTIVLAAQPRFERLATNSLRDGSTFNASPAVAGDRLYLRSDKSLYCVGKK